MPGADPKDGPEGGGPETAPAESVGAADHDLSPPAGAELDAALADLHAGDRAAAQLLGLAAFLADDPLPAWLPAEHPDALPDPLAERARAGEDAVLLVAGTLAGRDLASVGDRALRVPAGLAERVRGRMSVRERGEFASAAAHLLFRAFPDRVGRPEERRRSRLLAPHVLAVAEHPRGGGRTTAEVVHTLARLGAFFRSEDEPGRAEASFRRALEVSERGAPVEGPLRAVLADELASVLAGQGRAEEAVATARRAVELAEETVEPDSPQLPLLLSNAATTFREVGEAGRAARCYRRALEAASGSGSEAARPLVAELLAGLADAEMAREEWRAAEEAAERALSAAEESWGDPHPQTVRAAWMLGDARRELGRHAEAARLFRRALAAEEELQGGEHPAVGQKALGLARHLDATGRPDAAREAYRKAADAFGASLGPESDAARAARRRLEELDAEA